MTSYSQPGIFNALDYNLLTAPLGGTPSGNRTALQNAIYAAQMAGGGTVLIPSEVDGEVVYPIEGPIYVSSATSLSPVAVIIAGTGQGSESTPTLQVSGDGDLFSVDTGGTGSIDVSLPPPPSNEHIGGITFRDFSINYAGGTSGAAIHVIGGENVRIERMVFVDCPQAVWFEDTLQCTIFDCTAQYGNIVPSPSCIQLGNDESGVAAKEIYIAASTFLSYQQGGTGLIIQGAEHVRMTNVRVEGFTDGIMIVPGAAVSGGHNTLRHSFTDVSVYTYNPNGLTNPALTIQPRGPQNVSQIVFVNCQFELSEKASGSVGPGIYIDEGEFGSTIDNVRFVSCLSTRWSGPGIEITSGSNIEINGGFYAGNASSANPSGGSGGVSITGPASGVRIVGAACIGSYPYIEIDKIKDSPQQDVGIYIAGSGASDVIIDHCDLTGNGQHAVLIGAGGLSVSNVFIRNCNANGYGTLPADAIEVVGEVTNVQITDCAGYNDTAATLSTSAPSGAFSNTSFGYYGPVAFYCSGGTGVVVSIDGNGTGLASGSFTLSPGETAQFILSIGGHLPTTFFVVGK
jgi:hypothetical protein